MLWFSAAISLRNYLLAQLPGVDVSLGVTQEVPDRKTIKIRVLNDSEWPLKKLRFDGETTLGLDVWVKRGDVDREPYYQELSEVQDALFAVLGTWILPEPWRITDLNISLDTDDDRFLTGVGAQLILRVNWQRTDLI